MSHSYPDTQLLINGQWQEALGGKKIAVHNPATGEVIGHVAHAEITDLDLALDAAQKGFQVWKNTSAHERQAVMRRAAQLLRERANEIATVLTMEQGKPLAEAKGEVLAGAGIIDWFADEAMRVYGRIVPARRSDVLQKVQKEPVGPVAAFTPWNFPVNQIVRKISAALATGCSFLCKAPEETPASPAALFKCFVDAGVPAGVVGLVYGNPAEISSYLIAHPVIRKVTFTGSTPIGKHLAALAGQYMKRCTMELGGHAPVIIAADADVDLAVQCAGAAKLRNAGQVCISPTRFLVHSSLKKTFTEGMVDYFNSIKVGNGLEAGSQMGPLANARRITAMEFLVENAQASGAKVLIGGTTLSAAGNFFAPTVIDEVPLSADVFNNEPFGPVVAMRSFEQLEEAIVEANRLPYGLAAYAFTSSLKNAHQLSREVETGMLWINQPAIASAEMPFGGIKDSGYGSEGGAEALDAYLVPKAVSIAIK